MTSRNHDHRVLNSILLVLLYIAIVLSIAFLATVLQPGGPF